MQTPLPAEALAAAERIRHADIVIGIPSYQNARNIQHVIATIDSGISRYFPGASAVIVNSDAGSRDGTREAALSVRTSASHVLAVSHPAHPLQRVSAPSHGVPGKDRAFRLTLQLADLLDAQGCLVVEAGRRSLAPEWVDLLLRPVMQSGYDLAAPFYQRQRYEGGITSAILYPLMRALYGWRLRQPAGGDFGISRQFASRLLESSDWDSAMVRDSLEIWLTTTAMAEQYYVCQSFLGADLRDSRYEAADLSTTLEQAAGGAFSLMERYERVWRASGPSRPLDMFGFRYDAAPDSAALDVPGMVRKFRRASDDLAQIWSVALTPGTAAALGYAARNSENGWLDISDDVWVRVVYEFACAHARRALNRRHLLRSLTPLYLGKLASLVLETESLTPGDVEDRVEALCQTYENLKPYLISCWTGEPQPEGTAAQADPETFQITPSEVLHD